MAEYIKRESLVADFERCNDQNEKWTPQRVKTLILRQPTADVAPVRHAFWKEIGADKRGRGGIFRCAGADGCGKTHPYTCDYCPNCGARMDGARNGEEKD